MINLYKKHVWVIPEDRPNEEFINGFIDHPAVDEGQIRPLPVAGGWSAVLKVFRDVYIRKLRDFPLGHVILLVDHDNDIAARRSAFKEVVPTDIADRVFLLGCADEPEAFKKACNRRSFEDIGRTLADECDKGAPQLWVHDHLRHNDDDRVRLVATVKPFAFRA